MKPPNWSFFAYLGGDNNLARATETDLAQIAKTDPSQVSVVVEVGLPNRKSQLKKLTKRGLQDIQIGERIAGFRESGEALTEFLKIAKEQVADTKYIAAVLGSHGTGLRNVKPPKNGENPAEKGPPPGVMQAMSLGTPDGATLDNEQLLAGFSDAIDGEEPFAIIGCDACLMGMMEIAYQLRQVGEYFVASQDNESADGWPFDDVLLEFNDRAEPATVAKGIVTAFAAATKADDAATLSAVDLKVMEPLGIALDELGAALRPLVPKKINALANARGEARDFADIDYIDLFGFIKALKCELANPEIDALADRVLELIDKAVIATSKAPLVSGAHGMSIYLPNSPVIEEYTSLKLSKDAPNWHDFVVAYGSEFKPVEM